MRRVATVSDAPPPPSQAPTPPAGRRPAPWESPNLFEEKPIGSEHGYVAGGARRGCARDELVARCAATVPHVDLVWTPEAPMLVPPAEVPWLLEAVRRRTERDLRYNLKNGLYLLAVWSLLAVLWRGKYPLPLLLVLVLMLGAIPVVQPAAGLWRLRRRPNDYPREQAATFRYQVWLGTRRLVATSALAACLLAVTAAQLAAGLRYARVGGAMGAMAPVAGLDKASVANGQAWRLLTAELMHGHPLHLLLNLMALMAVGRLIEMHAHWLHVPTVFLFSALAASALSFYAPGPPLSVGASGGIMGMIGFLAVIGVRRRHLVPRGFLRSIALSVALTAATGLVAHRFIDNAAHAGGFAGGLLMGFAYVHRRGTDNEYRLAPSSPAKAAGVVSALALFGATAGTLFLLLAALRR
jgi:membrane associated rhomboid family serine protease